VHILFAESLQLEIDDLAALGNRSLIPRTHVIITRWHLITPWNRQRLDASDSGDTGRIDVPFDLQLQRRPWNSTFLSRSALTLEEFVDRLHRRADAGELFRDSSGVL